MKIMQESLYYQAHIERSLCWFVIAALKSFEHVCFDRTLDPEESLFEFYVSPDTKDIFLEVMDYFQKQGLVSNLRQLPNRITVLGEDV